MICLVLLISECPEFRGHLTKGEGHVCFAHPDCKGLTCGISIQYGGLHEMVEAEIRMDPCTQMLNVSTPNTEVMVSEQSIGTYCGLCDQHFLNNLSHRSKSGYLVPSPFGAYAPIVPNLPCRFLTFHFEHLLVLSRVCSQVHL